jgi:hypothetical protein
MMMGAPTIIQMMVVEIATTVYLEGTASLIRELQSVREGKNIFNDMTCMF